LNSIIVRTCNEVKSNGEIKIKKAQRFNETMKILKISEIFIANIFFIYKMCFWWI